MTSLIKKMKKKVQLMILVMTIMKFQMILRPTTINRVRVKVGANIDEEEADPINQETPLIPMEGVNIDTKFLKSGIPEKMSERVRAPIYNNDELEEEFDLNKRIAFGLNNYRRNIFFYCYRCKREGRSYIRYEFTSSQISICLIAFVL